MVALDTIRPFCLAERPSSEAFFLPLAPPFPLLRPRGWSSSSSSLPCLLFLPRFFLSPGSFFFLPLPFLGRLSPSGPLPPPDPSERISTSLFLPLPPFLEGSTGSFMMTAFFIFSLYCSRAFILSSIISLLLSSIFCLSSTTFCLRACLSSSCLRLSAFSSSSCLRARATWY